MNDTRLHPATSSRYAGPCQHPTSPTPLSYMCPLGMADTASCSLLVGDREGDEGERGGGGEGGEDVELLC